MEFNIGCFKISVMYRNRYKQTGEKTSDGLKVAVPYPETEKRLINEVKKSLSPHDLFNKIPAIKALKALAAKDGVYLGLRDAKDIVERHGIGW